jgi:hypothetical protein
MRKGYKNFWITPALIKSGKHTTAGNPVSVALRRGGWRGARVDSGWLHLYNGKHWKLATMPESCRRFLTHWLQGKPCEAMAFSCIEPPAKKGGE